MASADHDQYDRDVLLDEEAWIDQTRPFAVDGWDAIKAELERFFVHGPNEANPMHIVLPEGMMIPYSFWDLKLKYLHITIGEKVLKRDESHEYWAEDMHTSDNKHKRSTSELFEAIGRNPEIYTLHIKGARFLDDEMGNYFSRNIQRNTILTELHVLAPVVTGVDSRGHLSLAIADAFEPSLHSSIRRVRFENLNIKHHHTKDVLVHILRNSDVITHVGLGMIDPIGHGYSDLADAIKHSVTVKVLDLSGSDLMGEGIRTVLHGVIENRSLVGLNLSNTNDKLMGTPMDENDVLLHTILTAGRIDEFRMDNVKLTERAFVRMMFGRMITIRNLSLRGSIPGTLGAATRIGGVISSAERLETLDISDTGFDSLEAPMLIANGIKESRALERITFGPDESGEIKRAIMEVWDGIPMFENSFFDTMTKMDIRIRSRDGSIRSMT